MNSTPTIDPKQAAAQALEKLNPRRRKFVLAYCLTYNATKAAEAAGYKAKTARAAGSRLLTFVDVQTAIRAVFAGAGMSTEEIAARWAAVARGGLSDFFTKVEVEVRQKVPQPLAEAIAETKQAIDFEHRYAQAVALTGKELKAHQASVQAMRRQMIRWQLQLDDNPDATRLVDGPPLIEHRMQLDLVKAHEGGIFDLIKSITPTEFGNKVELRSPDAALDNLAKWQGMLTTKVDITTQGQALPAPAILGVMTLEQKKQLLDAKRKVQEGPADA